MWPSHHKSQSLHSWPYGGATDRSGNLETLSLNVQWLSNVIDAAVNASRRTRGLKRFVANILALNENYKS